MIEMRGTRNQSRGWAILSASPLEGGELETGEFSFEELPNGLIAVEHRGAGTRSTWTRWGEHRGLDSCGIFKDAVAVTVRILYG